MYRMTYLNFYKQLHMNRDSSVCIGTSYKMDDKVSIARQEQDTLLYSTVSRPDLEHI